MPLQHDRAAPLLHLIGNEIPLFSMSGLKHVYTSMAQWQVMARDTQGLHTANKQERNVVSICDGAAKTNTKNYKVPWKIMRLFDHLPRLSRHSLVWRHLSAQVANLHSGPACSLRLHTRLSLQRLLTRLLGDSTDLWNAIVITRANFAKVDSCNEQKTEWQAINLPMIASIKQVLK